MPSLNNLSHFKRSQGAKSKFVTPQNAAKLLPTQKRVKQRLAKRRLKPEHDQELERIEDFISTTLQQVGNLGFASSSLKCEKHLLFSLQKKPVQPEYMIKLHELLVDKKTCIKRNYNILQKDLSDHGKILLKQKFKRIGIFMNARLLELKQRTYNLRITKQLEHKYKATHQ